MSLYGNTIIEEGKILDKIKGKISNIINKDTKSKNFKIQGNSNQNNNDEKDVEFTHDKVSSKGLFDKLYNLEVYTAEGFKGADDYDTIRHFVDIIAVKWDFKAKGPIKIYYCKGKDLNSIYHLTTDNRYEDKLNILFIDWQSSFTNDFDAVKYKGSFRYFSDVVDNNARREIWKYNKFYKNYHSLYGDEWFWKSVRDMNPDWDEEKWNNL